MKRDANGFSLPFHPASYYSTIPSPTWLAKPWIVKGGITEVVGTHKEAGKTTFILRGLVYAILNGLPFLGEPTLKSSILYLSEQTGPVIKKDLEAAKVIEHKGLSLLQWHDIAELEWRTVAKKLREDVKTSGAQLVVVDTLGQFAFARGESENDSVSAVENLRPLQLLAEQTGAAVLLVRHERKAGGSTARAGRGSTAYGGGVDIILRIKRKGGKGSRVRLIQSLSRFEETPEESVVELTEKDGYILASDSLAKKAQDKVLGAINGIPVTVIDLQTSTHLPRSTVQRALEELVEFGMIESIGAGSRGSPKKYTRKIVQTS